MKFQYFLAVWMCISIFLRKVSHSQLVLFKLRVATKQSLSVQCSKPLLVSYFRLYCTIQLPQSNQPSGVAWTIPPQSGRTRPFVDRATARRRPIRLNVLRIHHAYYIYIHIPRPSVCVLPHNLSTLTFLCWGYLEGLGLCIYIYILRNFLNMDSYIANAV